MTGADRVAFMIDEADRPASVLETLVILLHEGAEQESIYASRGGAEPLSDTAIRALDQLSERYARVVLARDGARHLGTQRNLQVNGCDRRRQGSGGKGPTCGNQHCSAFGTECSDAFVEICTENHEAPKMPTRPQADLRPVAGREG